MFMTEQLIIILTGIVISNGLQSIITVKVLKNDFKWLKEKVEDVDEDVKALEKDFAQLRQNVR